MFKRAISIAFFILLFTSVFAQAASLNGVDLSRVKRIAVYMGTFDPPHKGHAKLARGILEKAGVDYVIVLPLPQAIHKKNALDFEHRLRMTQIAFAEDEHLLVPEDDRSARKIIADIKALNPEVTVLGVVGSDYLNGKIKWLLNRVYQMFSGIDITAVVLRDSGDFAKLRRIRSSSVESFELAEERPESSTEVRKGNLDLVDPEVKKYIQVHDLYNLGSSQKCSLIFADIL